MVMKCNAPYITDYMESVRGEIPASKDILAAMDLIEKKLSEPDVVIESDQAEKAAELIERYFDMKLIPWELFILGLIHCYHQPSDMVVFDEFYIMMGRGNGKNGFISGLAWYLTTHYHGIKGYNVDIIANSEDQAMVSFDDVYEVLERTWDTSKRFFYKTKEIIRNLKTGSYIKYNTSNARTKDGKRSACLIFDERHEYESSENIGVFASGFGKRKHSRIFSITTNGYVRDGVLDEDLRLCADVLNGSITDLGLCPLLYQMDSDEECDNPDLWEKANPSIRYFPELRKEIEKAWIKKKYDKQTELDFYTKRMNRPRTPGVAPVTEWANIIASRRPIPDLRGMTCVAGLDYAMITDFASVNLHFRDDDIRYDINHSWLCLQSRDLVRIKADWRQWADNGLLTLVDDVQIHPDLIAEWLEDKMLSYNIAAMAIDNHRYGLVSDSMRKIGFDAKVGKNLKLVRPNDIMQVSPLIDSIFAMQGFVWGDNKVLRWATNNAMRIVPGARAAKRMAKVAPESTGNYVYGKIEGKSRKTDPFMALVASMTIEDRLTGEGSTFDDLPVIIG